MNARVMKTMTILQKLRPSLLLLLAAPPALWLTATTLLPLAGGLLKPLEAWLLSLVIGLLCGLCLTVHGAAHMLAAHAGNSELPSQMPLYPFGDAAQVWPTAQTPWREFLISMAGPLANALLAVGAYLLWNAQLTSSLSLVMLILAIYNGVLVVINLIPVFPLDGGRLLRSIYWGLLRRSEDGSGLERRWGFIMSLFLFGWGVFLLTQNTRHSRVTGGTTLLFAALVFIPLLAHPSQVPERALPAKACRGVGQVFRVSLAVVLIAGLLGLTFALIPLNSGLEMPGVSPSIEPMISVPPEYSHPSEGSFILTTVYQQTPILLGQWLYGQVSPIAQVVPPERVVPPDQTVREIALRNLQMLETSRLTAVAAGLTLAGYEVIIDPDGIEFLLPIPVSIIPQRITGGPSAGLMFTLAIFDLLTPEDLTGGRLIAGTGTITLDGRVGSIGGVRQKVGGAENAGAEYFLTPPENYDEALFAARRIKVVRVTTASEAIEFLKSLPPKEN